MSTSQTRDRLALLLDAPLSSLGLDLEGVELTTAGRRRVLRVAVDKDGGVTMDDIAEANRAVGRLLDDSDAMGELPYTLEVSSPGVDRPLTLPRHWRRNAGRLVKVWQEGRQPLVGRIVDSDDHAVRLDVDGAAQEVRLDDVDRARVQVELPSTGSVRRNRRGAADRESKEG